MARNKHGHLQAAQAHLGRRWAVGGPSAVVACMHCRWASDWVPRGMGCHSLPPPCCSADRWLLLVCVQANVSRKKAVKALKSADGDIVSAIMELTM